MRAPLVLVLAAGIAPLVLGSAEARPLHHRVVHRVVVSDDISTLPLTVNRRSWLDPGTAVSPNGGSRPAYLAANTQFEKTQDRIFAPDLFGNDVMKGQPYVPGPTQPVVEFSTLPNGQVVVDNALLPQNFYYNPAPSVP